MIEKPTPFADAIAYLRKRGILPTTLTTDQLSKVEASIRRYAQFSATVTNAEFLDEAGSLVQKIIDPQYAGGAPGTAVDIPRARAQLLSYLRGIGYAPEEGKAGTLQDLSSNARLDLIVRTNTQMAQGYGQHVQANDATVLDAFPAQELFRLQQRAKPREWVTRWRNAGGRFYGGGRMIALKDDPIWTEISRFGNPYPPFDFNSGMWVKPVPRREALEFGLIAKGQQVKPSEIAFATPAKTGIEAFSKPILDALQKALPGAQIVDGVLTIKEP